MSSTTIDFAQITNPTPQPYDDKNPSRQRENFYYVLNQVVDLLKQQGATLDIDITGAVLDLSFAGAEIDMPGFNIKRSGRVVTIELTP